MPSQRGENPFRRRGKAFLADGALCRKPRGVASARKGPGGLALGRVGGRGLCSRAVWTGLDHVLVAVADVDAAAGPFARLLGRRPSWRGEHPATGTENVLFRLENTVLELIAPSEPGPVSDALRARLAAHGEGLVGLALGTQDAAACAAGLRARGLDAGDPEAEVGRDVQSGAFRRWRRVALPPSQTRGVVIFAVERTSPPEILPEAPPLFGEDAAVVGVDHVVVQSPAPDATRALYGEQLGIRLALDREFPQWGVRLLFFRLGDLTLEVAARLGGAATDPGVDALWGLSYRVRDADAARARVSELGFDVSEVRAGRRPGTRVFTVRDAPAGVATLMLEPPAPPPASES